jgi:hypothetical protein
LDYVQVNVENVFNGIYRAVIFKKLCDAKGPLASIVPSTKLFYGAHSFFYYQHGRHVKGVTIIESFSSMNQVTP